jgi:spore coat protein JA
MYWFRNCPNPFTHQIRTWSPYVSPCDPCPPQTQKTYVVPPNQYLGFQPPYLPQFQPHEALCYGTLWPMLYSPYAKGVKA